MAVADVFDALISQRVYKPAMSYEKTREIIADGSGSHFDPDIVAAFLEDFDAMTAIADQYQDRGNPETT
jgi:putative two-component system response regulator